MSDINGPTPAGPSGWQPPAPTHPWQRPAGYPGSAGSGYGAYPGVGSTSGSFPRPAVPPTAPPGTTPGIGSGVAPGTGWPPHGGDPNPAGPSSGGPHTGGPQPPEERPSHALRAVVTVLAVAVVGLVAGFGGGMLGASMSSSDTTSPPTLTQQSSNQTASNESPSAPKGSVQEVAAKVLPSVVSVVALSAHAESEGSGVVLTSTGLILTNNHVIDGAATLTVQFNDGTTGSATVVGTDPTDDLAVLKVAGVSGLQAATLGTSADVQVGQDVVAVGSPLGLSATVTSGIVSALNRPVRTSDAADEQNPGTVLSAIQTDAAINPGNSGGPLVDMNGYVIGINSAIAALTTGSDGQAGSIGVGFAIPIDQAHRIAQEIIDNGHASHAVLGANVINATDAARGITTGAEIKSVVADSGAEKAGLQAGDIVTKVDSIPIESSDALVAAIRASTPGGTVKISYLRGGQADTVTVTLGSATD